MQDGGGAIRPRLLFGQTVARRKQTGEGEIEWTNRKRYAIYIDIT